MNGRRDKLEGKHFGQEISSSSNVTEIQYRKADEENEDYCGSDEWQLRVHVVAKCLLFNK